MTDAAESYTPRKVTRAPKVGESDEIHGPPAPVQASDTSVVWEDPTPSRAVGGARGSGRHYGTLQKLMAHPGNWARVFLGGKKRAYSFCNHMRNIVKTNPDTFGPVSDWQFASRLVDPENEVGAGYVMYAPKED